MITDCPPTYGIHVHRKHCCHHPVLNVYIHIWLCFHVCLCSSQWFIETALCFQVGSGTVAFMSSSASEKVGQVRGQGGCPLTPDLTPSPTHWPLLNRNGWSCGPVPFPHRAVISGVLFLDPVHIRLFCVQFPPKSETICSRLTRRLAPQWEGVDASGNGC